nr:MAG TPA: hypothetical protein [Caudoviricetes sp.]
MERATDKAAPAKAFWQALYKEDGRLRLSLKPGPLAVRRQ